MKDGSFQPAARSAQSQFGPAAEQYLSSAVHANEAALAHYMAVSNPNGGTVIDVATGAGHLAMALAPHVDRVVACDVTESMLEVTRREAANRGISNLETRVADAMDLPFARGEVDGVACRLAAHHFAHPDRFLSEAARVLRPNGWFLLVDNVGLDDPHANEELNAIEYERDASHVRYFLEADWIAWCGSNGLEVTHTDVTSKPLQLEAWLDRMSVQEPTRSRLRDRIMNSHGLLRSYLRPIGEGDTATFHLSEMVLFAHRRD